MKKETIIKFVNYNYLSLITITGQVVKWLRLLVKLPEIQIPALPFLKCHSD